MTYYYVVCTTSCGMYVGIEDEAVVHKRLATLETQLSAMQEMQTQLLHVMSHLKPPSPPTPPPPHTPPPPPSVTSSSDVLAQLKVMKDIMSIFQPQPPRAQAVSTPSAMIPTYMSPRQADNTYTLETIERIAKMFK